jgi:regulator of sigma E protease
MITTVVSFVLVLGFLIFIHELGHFAVAKWSGVGVEKFSLGFGPKLLGFKKGETEYVLSLLPLGGYVKMVGEQPGEELSDFDRSRSFTHKPVSIRALIVVAGPIMNLILAVVLLPIIFMVGVQIPVYLDGEAEIGYVVAGERADVAGIKNGDVVVSANGKDISNWEEFITTLTLNPNSPLDLTLRRGGADVNLTLTPEVDPDTGGGYAGIYPPMRPIIGSLSAGYPAKEAGLAEGDIIRAIDGVDIVHWAELESFVKKEGVERSFLIEREMDGEASTFSVKIKPKFNEDAEVFLIGVSRFEETFLRRYGFTDAVVRGVSSSIEMTGRLFMVIKGLLFGRYSLKTLGGPIMIAQVAGRAVEAGIIDLLSLVSFLSLQLGIINLFPIPVLDGGHLFFFGVEAIKGKPLSERFVGIAQQIGIALLIALMVLVTYNDILRIF